MHLNIFVLSINPREAAKWHVDKHTVEMPIETAQILCTVRALYGDKDIPYRTTYIYHPCCHWAAESAENYVWLCILGIELCDEYTYRYGKKHKSQQVLLDIQDHYFPILNDLFYYNRYGIEISEPPLCVPDHCTAGPGGYRMNYVDVYRKYYNLHKSHLFTYTNRDKPEWLQKLD